MIETGSNGKAKQKNESDPEPRCRMVARLVVSFLLSFCSVSRFPEVAVFLSVGGDRHTGEKWFWKRWPAGSYLRRDRAGEACANDARRPGGGLE